MEEGMAGAMVVVAKEAAKVEESEVVSEDHGAVVEKAGEAQEGEMVEATVEVAAVVD